MDHNNIKGTYVPHDGDLHALKPNDEDTTRAEFVDTNGRRAWRLYNRVGYGVMITEPEMVVLRDLLTATLENKSC